MDNPITSNGEINLRQQEKQYRNPDLTFSVCSVKDIQTWRETSLRLLEFVPSEHYVVIVPDEETSLFRSNTDRKIDVVPETAYVGNLKDKLLPRMPNECKSRTGWYLQQFVKLAVLKTCRPAENFLIWDADTVPIKMLRFFERSGQVQIYTGAEFHPPYFQVIQNLLGVGKLVSFSFIAQCFPCKGTWASEFFSFLENKFSKHYVDVLSERINFAEESGFSEYETLGTFIVKFFGAQLELKQTKWLRNGTGLIGGARNLTNPSFKQFASEFDHVTFERSEEPFSLLKKMDEEFIKYFHQLGISARQPLEIFLENLFDSGKARTIITLGTGNARLTKTVFNCLESKRGYEAVVAEAVPSRAEALRIQFHGRPDIKILNTGADSFGRTRDIHFIPFDFEIESNADRLPKTCSPVQWAFKKKAVEKWLDSEEFTSLFGEEASKICHESIQMHRISTQITDKIIPHDRQGLIVVINAPGIEFEILGGIDWNNPPRWVIVQGSADTFCDLLNYFHTRGFDLIAGNQNLAFSRS